VFGGQQLTWLFSAAFLRNRQAVQETIALPARNPNPVEPQAYDRQAQAYLHFDALDRLGGITAPTLVIVGEQDLLTPPWVAREVAGGIPGRPVRDRHRRRLITRGAAGASRRLQSASDELPGRVTSPEHAEFLGINPSPATDVRSDVGVPGHA
jgi:pimeloyl-ACP methyl ester carboxylesterase